MAAHQWQCLKCGKKSSLLVSSNPDPNPSKMGGKCPGTPTGEHILCKIK